MNTENTVGTGKRPATKAMNQPIEQAAAPSRPSDRSLGSREFNRIGGETRMSVRERRVARGVFERFFDGGSVYVLRFTSRGERHYVTLGTRADGWDDRRATEEYANVMADVRRRIWLPPDRTKAKRAQQRAEERTIPTFETFAAGYLDGRVGEVSERSVAFERWAVDLHLRPFFGNYVLDEIDTQLVDDYRRHKVSQSRARRAAIEAGRPLTARIRRREHVLRPFGATTINKTIEILQTILTQAVEYKLILENPAEGKRRRLAVPPKQTAHLESVDEIEALLEAAADLDRQRRLPHGWPAAVDRDADLRRPSSARAVPAQMAQRRPRQPQAADHEIQDEGRHPHHRRRPDPPRRADRLQGRLRLHRAGRLRLPNRDRRHPRQGQRAQPRR